jgi:hypothetical protein
MPSSRAHESHKAGERESQPEPGTAYRDRPSDDGKHGDGGANPSGVGEESKVPERV